MSNAPEDSPLKIPDSVRQQLADAEAQAERDLADAREAGIEAARKRAPGYHDPSEPRNDSEPPPPEPKPARARRTDPPTSQEAARSIVMPKHRESQVAVLEVFRKHGPMTDDELLEAYETESKCHREKFPTQAVSGIRTRRSELVRDKLLVDSGEKKRLPSGRRAIIWKETRHVDGVRAGSAESSAEA